MASRLYNVTVDCRDPRELARFWSAVLDYKVTYDDGEEVAIETVDEVGPALLFLRAPDSKVVKNRIHFDLAPDDHDAEVERATGLGATRVDIGQHEDEEVTWVVMADPEGNEFCILTPRQD
ncbi:MAG: VOC family protein [Actinobacteria bacterium]|nr:VOC family protein [Actinomycetota bacterium]